MFTESRHQLCDVAEGLHFLHLHNVVHGDLKGVCWSKSCFSIVLIGPQANILVDGECHARITDFGLTTVTQNVDSIRSNSGDRAHTVRWTAPEILMDEGIYSKEADVFSFAMVMVEVCYKWVIRIGSLLIVARDRSRYSPVPFLGLTTHHLPQCWRQCRECAPQNQCIQSSQMICGR